MSNPANTSADAVNSRLWNPDLAPVPIERRTWNKWDIAALGLAILPHAPGFFAEVGWVPPESVSPFLRGLYDYSWFSGFFLAFVLHCGFARLFRAKQDCRRAYADD